MRKIYIFDYLCNLFYLFCFTNKITNDEKRRNIRVLKLVLIPIKTARRKLITFFTICFKFHDRLIGTNKKPRVNPLPSNPVSINYPPNAVHNNG